MKDEWLDKFMNEAIPKIVREIKPSQIIIFGSRARGDAKSISDIDVIIVSDYFKDIPFLRRMPILLKLVNFEKHIDFLCYTEDEFEKIKEKSIVVNDALKHSLRIEPSSPSSTMKVKED